MKTITLSDDDWQAIRMELEESSKEYGSFSPVRDATTNLIAELDSQ